MALLLNHSMPHVPALKPRSISGLHALPSRPEADRAQAEPLEPIISTLIHALATVDKATRSQIETSLVQLALSPQNSGMSQIVLQAVAQGLLHASSMVSGTCAMVLIRSGQVATPFVNALPTHWAVDFVRQELAFAA